jgi:hypothetical protein
MSVVDLQQKLVPPDYRNLVINPSGEATYAASWFASNGVVTEGSTATTPLYGTGVAEYEVTQTTALSYFVSPFGPDGVVHHGAFEIAAARSIAARVSVRAPVTVWVQLQARYMVWGGSDFSEVEVRALGAAVQAVSGSWTAIERFADTTVPTGASHWQLYVSISETDPGAGVATHPPVGRKLWIDGAFVPDSGLNLAGIAYVDGNQASCYWEDEPNFSTSRTGTPPIQASETLAVEVVPETTTDPDDTTDPPVEVPETHDALPDPQAQPVGPQEQQAFGATVADAAKFVATRTGNTTFSLSEDIQLSDLIFNRLDEDGVVWIVTDVEGWWTLPEPDVPDLPKGWDDGSYETRGRYQARVFTLNGIFFPRSRGLVSRARDRLIRAANLCHRGGYFMTHEADYTRGSKVFLSGAPQIATTAMSGRTEFSIGLKAPDPVKYGFNGGKPPGLYNVSMASQSVRLPGRVYPREYSEVTGVWTYPEAVFGAADGTISNDGNTFTSPTFTLAGPTNGPVQIINASTAQTMRVNRQLYAGEQLVVDCFTKQVTLNRAPNQRFYLDVDTDWITLQPGGNMFYFLEEGATSNAALLTVTWRPGWIG